MGSKQFDMTRGLSTAEKKLHAAKYGLAIPGEVVQFGQAGPGAMEAHDFTKEIDVNTVSAIIRKGGYLSNC